MECGEEFGPHLSRVLTLHSDARSAYVASLTGDEKKHLYLEMTKAIIGSLQLFGLYAEASYSCFIMN